MAQVATVSAVTAANEAAMAAVSPPPTGCAAKRDQKRRDTGHASRAMTATDQAEAGHHVNEAAEAGRDLRRVLGVDARVGGAEGEAEADDRGDHQQQRHHEDAPSDRARRRGGGR